MREEKEILLRGKVCAYLTCRLMSDPSALVFVCRLRPYYGRRKVCLSRLDSGVDRETVPTGLSTRNGPTIHFTKTLVGLCQLSGKS